jgi:ParE toxin of type II toxin-antitoxin system, parDE
MRILTALHRFAETGEGDVKKLQGESGELRLRVGDYRVPFTEEHPDTLRIHAVFHRRQDLVGSDRAKRPRRFGQEFAMIPVTRFRGERRCPRKRAQHDSTAPCPHQQGGRHARRPWISEQL